MLFSSRYMGPSSFNTVSSKAFRQIFSTSRDRLSCPRALWNASLTRAGPLQVVQAQLQLQQVTAIAGVGPGHHHAYRQPFLEFVLVDYRQRRAGRALGFGLQG